MVSANQASLRSSDVGRHSEVLVIAALLANGYIALESTVPESYDVAATTKGSREIERIQVKTIFRRKKEGVDYCVIRGVKGDGTAYSKDECDTFAGVLDGRVYLTANRELQEYWCKESELDEKWAQLPVKIQ